MTTEFRREREIDQAAAEDRTCRVCGLSVGTSDGFKDDNGWRHSPFDLCTALSVRRLVDLLLSKPMPTMMGVVGPQGQPILVQVPQGRPMAGP